MKKYITYLIVILVAFILVLPGNASAQGMMDFNNSDTEANQSLSDDDYEKLGEQWMELMTGDNHEAADEQMRTMMGEDFFRQMHIAMGKRSQSPGSYGMMPMLAPYFAGGNSSGMGMMSTGHNWPLVGSQQFSGIHSFLMIITWLTFIAFLLAGTRWFWKRANR